MTKFKQLTSLIAAIGLMLVMSAQAQASTVYKSVIVPNYSQINWGCNNWRLQFDEDVYRLNGTKLPFLGADEYEEWMGLRGPVYYDGVQVQNLSGEAVKFRVSCAV